MCIQIYQTKFGRGFLRETLNIPTLSSATGYNTFNFPLYRPIEQSFIESTAIRLFTKTGEDVFEDILSCSITL